MPLNKSSKLWWFVDSISTSQIELYLDAERSSASSCVLKTVGRRKTRRLVLTCCFPLALNRLPNRGMSPTKGTRLFEILMSSWIRPPSTMVCRSSAKIVVSIVLFEVTTSANALPPTGVLMTLVICWATSSRTSEPLCTCGVTCVPLSVHPRQSCVIAIILFHRIFKILVKTETPSFKIQ